MGEDLEVAMTFLRKAQVTLQISEEQLSGCERYFLSALQLRKDDIASLVDLAIFSQCCGKLTRAELCYCLALDQQPLDYMIPGYLHRVHMVDRLLLNYHRFCSVFNMSQTNILAKVIPIARRGEQVRFMVSRLNQFTVIAPADENNLCRFNSVFLTDEEVYQILVEHEKKENSENGSFVNESYQDLVAMKYLTAHASMRTNTRTSTRNVHRRSTIQKKVDEAKESITLLFQPRFQGLRVRPASLAGVSEARSKLRVSRENAERLLKDLVFIASDDDTEQQQPASVHRVVLHLSVLKRRQHRRREMAESFALVNIQRMVRGFRVRARIRRVKLLQSIHQQQVDELYARLHHNYVIREQRRTSAIAIQRIFRGYAQRRLLSRWHQGAENIQRMYRGHRGRKRAIAFRDGNLTFYMSERVFQRGMNIGGHQVMLIIDKCGLSFRLEAFDMSRCTTYPGFVSHESAMGVLRYCNWSYAQSLTMVSASSRMIKRPITLQDIL
ncbi:hypothetical protein Poli38472_002318 [Pythium oligandrum]|uniref:Uncharacterized protein n=1 Tax=Pythium oligandrum TaxID=41045 RepID=A0A8K1FL15_PYTOL|nr:hypothetical protein Poli38472_002318 [Pythium oligandrum]|eukprot:TMW63377.1 hypothetical protein Poli38472_002318 [Pythium oligandrum]